MDEKFCVDFSAPLRLSRSANDAIADLQDARVCQRCGAMIFDDLTELHAKWHNTIGA